jgi:hypothetical protein
MKLNAGDKSAAVNLDGFPVVGLRPTQIHERDQTQAPRENFQAGARLAENSSDSKHHANLPQVCPPVSREFL